MKWLTRIGLVVIALIAVCAVVPFFVTLDDHLPLVEKEISARLKEPVSIDGLQASMFPTPHVRVDGIAVGADSTGSTWSVPPRCSRNRPHRAARRDSTSFPDLVREGKAYRFTQLKIASRALSAQGHTAIAPSRALSGQLNTSVKPVGSIAAIPLTVAGTRDSPVVYPSAGALIGAAAGTAVLPGLGTAAGVKLGGFVEGLLGKRK